LLLFVCVEVLVPVIDPIPLAISIRTYFFSLAFAISVRVHVASIYKICYLMLISSYFLWIYVTNKQTNVAFARIIGSNQSYCFLQIHIKLLSFFIFSSKLSVFALPPRTFLFTLGIFLFTLEFNFIPFYYP
jgi:hypothetical protein